MEARVNSITFNDLKDLKNLKVPEAPKAEPTFQEVMEHRRQFIRDNYQTMSDGDMAKALNIKIGSLKKSRIRMRLLRGGYPNKPKKKVVAEPVIAKPEVQDKAANWKKAWKKSDSKFIKDNLDKLFIQEIADTLGRTSSAIQTKINSFGYTTSYGEVILDKKPVLKIRAPLIPSASREQGLIRKFIKWIY